MKPNDQLDDQALRTLMESLPMSPITPDNLKSKLVDLAASPASRHRSIRRPVFAFAAVVATVALAGALITTLPAEAKSWDDIKRAVQSIASMDLTIVDARNQRIHSQVHIEPALIQVRLSSGDFMVVDKRMIRTYDRSDNHTFDLLLPSDGSGPNIREMVLGELSMARILAQYEEEYGTEHMKIGPNRSLDGREVYDVTLRDPKSPARGVLIVDAETDLPIVLELHEPQDGKVQKTMELRSKFNGSTQRLVNTTPAGAKHESVPMADFIAKNGGELPKLNFSFRRLLRD